MAWGDPSPRAHARPAARRPSAQPGYGDAPVSFGRLALRGVLAGLVGMIACLFARSGLAAWHGQAAHSAGLDIALAAAIGFAAGALAFRFVMNRPASHGLDARVRDGRAWGSGGYCGDAVDNLMATEVVVDLAEMAADVIPDL